MMPEGQRGPLKGKRKEPEEGWSAGQQETPNDGQRAGRSRTEGELSRRDGIHEEAGPERKISGGNGGSQDETAGSAGNEVV